MSTSPPRLRPWLGALVSYAWLVCLPLVGRAGAAAPHAARNFAASLALLAAALALTVPAARHPGAGRVWRVLACAQGVCLALLLSGALRA